MTIAGPGGFSRYEIVTSTVPYDTAEYVARQKKFNMLQGNLLVINNLAENLFIRSLVEPGQKYWLPIRVKDNTEGYFLLWNLNKPFGTSGGNVAVFDADLGRWDSYASANSLPYIIEYSCPDPGFVIDPDSLTCIGQDGF